MLSAKLRLMVVVGMFLCAAQAALCDDLIIVTEDYPPLNYLEGDILVGPSVEIIKAIQDDLKNTIDIKVMPWSRGYTLTEQGENYVLFSTTQTPERKNKFKWVGPLAIKSHAFYTRAGSNITINSLEEAKALSIGVQLKGSSQDYLEGNGFENLDPAPTWNLTAKKLLLGRVDAWFSSMITAEEAIRRSDLQADIKLSYIAAEFPTFIAFSLNVPDSTVAKWQAARDKIYNDGTALEIFKRYDLEFLYPHPKDDGPY